MGIKQVDLVTPLTSGPSPLNPPGKPVYTKVFQVTRTNTATTLKAMLPAQASILAINQKVGAVSNAGTTAAITLTVTSNAGTLSTGALDALTAGTSDVNVPMTSLPNIEPLPLAGDISISAIYAETGTASTLGGPWNFVVTYV